ncbi:hypothetical protein [Paraliomyxa miuraensis]|uniref:hypothetical protein n=1 Tax=Paraliomyxa miuraensis TaxID=376150 RepID=UPI00225A4289|nr:hypothetical protein [Paraliomyxa miuraensis]MCX4248052.1 hypothetical protein [Paraliomyxa miuraensis]
MRWTLISLTSLGLLVPGCGDDTSPIIPMSPMATDSSTTAGETTVGDPDSTGDTADSTSGETAAVDSSGSTGPGFECGDDVVEGDEVCDGTELGEETCLTQGFDGGDLACLADCSGYDTRGCLLAVCGDGIAVGSELCDGRDTAESTCETEGFDNGALLCMEDCASFDTSGCGICGNNQVDGAEACDGVWLQGQDCFTQGFDSGTIACGVDCLAYDTSGCGLCGNGITDGEEVCDGADVGGVTCNSLGFAAMGNPTCLTACDAVDVYTCGVMQYDVSTPISSAGSINRFRGNGYVADGNGVLVDFSMYLNLPAACNVDFYVFESTMPTGAPLTQVARSTVNAGPGTDYVMAGIPLVPITTGMYYVLGAGTSCNALFYWEISVGTDVGVGIANNNRWDNAYPGPSDMYVPPNTGTNNIYVQQVFFGD